MKNILFIYILSYVSPLHFPFTFAFIYTFDVIKFSSFIFCLSFSVCLSLILFVLDAYNIMRAYIVYVGERMHIKLVAVELIYNILPNMSQTCEIITIIVMFWIDEKQMSFIWVFWLKVCVCIMRFYRYINFHILKSINRLNYVLSINVKFSKLN